MPHGGGGHFNHLIRRLAQLVLHMNGRRGDERMNPGILCAVQSLPGAIDIGLGSTGKRRNLHSTLHGVGDGVHGLEIPDA